jgi:hypothetical protein
VEETNTETEESPVSEEESLFSDGVGELFSSGDTIVYDADEMEPFKSRTLKRLLMNMQRQDMPEQLIQIQTVPHGIRNRALLPRHMRQEC